MYVHIYIYMYSIIYCKQTCPLFLFFLDHPISSRRKKKTNVLACVTFIMKKQPFILENKCSFLLADSEIFIEIFMVC